LTEARLIDRVASAPRAPGAAGPNRARPTLDRFVALAQRFARAAPIPSARKPLSARAAIRAWP